LCLGFTKKTNEKKNTISEKKKEPVLSVSSFENSFKKQKTRAFFFPELDKPKKEKPKVDLNQKLWKAALKMFT